MKKNADSYLPAKVKKSLCRFFAKSFIGRLGRSSGFVKGKAQKITAFYFVAGFVLCSLRLHNTNIYLWLFFICLFMQKIYMLYRDKVQQASGGKASVA